MSSSSNNARIWQWTLTPEAIASCFANDVLEMRDNGVKDSEFFWLGRVPCRSVKLAGLLVGVQAYESRIVYSLDDGSAVIECVYRPPPSKEPKPLLPPLLKPVAYVGDSVFIVGRISPWRDTRRIMLDSISKCPSADDEPRHWIKVRALHKNNYQLNEPWQIPVRPPPPTAPLVTTAAPPTPSSSAPSSAASSPIKSTTSPLKLRHPSRLHTQELTDNAFRIYVKHYMDNVDRQVVLPAPPTTPTKTSHFLPLGDETPRPYDRTPRRIIPLDFAQPHPPEPDKVPERRGFTMSYLRRVPELALMAKRVVKATAKRRAREERKQAKASGKALPIKHDDKDRQKLHPRMKRLFVSMIQQLVKDGDVIIWDTSRPYSELEPQVDGDVSGGMWKVNSSHSTVGVDSTAISTASILEEDEDEGVLTDPEEDEQAYISLATGFVGEQVELAIKQMEEGVRAQANGRSRALPPGPSAKDVLNYLKRDDAWQFVSELAIKEGLEWLKEEGRAWMVGGERWKLTV
ncbi:hypothetical protein FB45DRAFT_887099 [Roridomyces roridus]|uniref:CST complex subunit STN1 n=1 Tax=Roridomyces roridus TaxID=1738132 RepID=A0AAD7CIU0_9AGAR|nr:hypothetical protein FB45DRAFT_887099 [Roridomyces roridus]